MPNYYVHTIAQSNGDHEVHETGCTHGPYPTNSKYLGTFSNCYEAVREAKKTYPQSNGCYYCCYPCHTS